MAVVEVPWCCTRAPDIQLRPVAGVHMDGSKSRLFLHTDSIGWHRFLTRTDCSCDCLSRSLAGNVDTTGLPAFAQTCRYWTNPLALRVRLADFLRYRPDLQRFASVQPQSGVLVPCTSGLRGWQWYRNGFQWVLRSLLLELY